MSYDAVSSTTRRSAPVTDLRSEDNVLRYHERDMLVSTARDAKRNYVVASWMIRKHLDFVSDFTFEANTPNEPFNDAVKALMAEWVKRRNCHVAGMHPLRRLIRLGEASRVMDGDVFWELMKDGTVGLIRGDRIRNRRGFDNSREWTHGVHLGRRQQALGYLVHRRSVYGSFEFEKYLPAKHAIQNGYFDDTEQIRGVSPLSVAINNLRDTYEGIDFALARLKLEQILGVAITKKAFDAGGNPFSGNRQFQPHPEAISPEEEEELQEATADEESRSGLIDFGKGIWQVELNDGEDIKSIAGNMPSSNAQQFLDACIHLALKALDLPVSFWNEAHTNFFGSRGALQLYKRSAHSKQADNQEVLDEITLWKLREWVSTGRLALPRGWHVNDVESQWVPRGIPWWDRSKEIIGDLRAIGAGLDNPINVCLDHGTGNPYDHIDQTAKVYEYARQKLGQYGVTLNFGLASFESQEDKPQKSQETEE